MSAIAIPGVDAASYVEGLRSREVQIQPAGIDLTVWKVFRFKSRGYIGFHSRVLAGVEEVAAVDGKWVLQPGPYKVVFREVVSVPPDCIAVAFPRSTLLRCGVDLRTALWDPGYIGRSEALLVVHNPHGVELEVGARIAQLVFIKLVSKPHKLYSGTYQYENV